MDKYPLSTIAALLGATESELQGVLRKNRLLNEMADEYDLVTPIQAYVNHLREKTADGQKALQEKIKTDLMRLELERKQGAFIPAIEVQNALRDANNRWIQAFSFLEKTELNKGIKNYAS